MKLLVIEDEEKCGAFLNTGLTESGYAVDLCRDGESGLKMALSGTYDLIILDVMLPGSDGWSVMKQLRENGQQVPVLFLSALGSLPERVKGLDLGADDFLAKPFAFSELLARVKSILRRGPTRPSDILKVGDLEADCQLHRASRGGKRLELTPKEFLLLSLLMRRRGEVVTRRTLAEQVWDMHIDPETNVVDVHIRRLRSKVDDPFERRLIHTVRGMGYVLEDRH